MVGPFSKTKSSEVVNCPDRSRENASVPSTNTPNGFVGDLSLRYRVFFWAIALGVGLLRALDSRFSMGGDGPSYIEMGDAYFRGDWKMAISSYWSPLYSWLIVLPKHIFRVPMYWESTSVHLVNFVIYVFVVCSLEFLLDAMILRGSPTNSLASAESLQAWALRLMGYALFLYSSLNWLSTETVTPDLCVEGIVFLVAGVILRIHAHGANWANCATLGLLLAVGYLTKVVLFPLAFVFFLASVLAAGNPRKAVVRVLFGFLIFLLVAGPYIFVLSNAKGRFTYGDSGRLNYAMYVDGLPLSVHWQGKERGSGTPVHPTRKVLDDPPLYEFAEPVGGSYPAWYDPTYWWEGVIPRFDAKREILVFHNHLHFFYGLLTAQGAFLSGLLAFCLVAPDFKMLARQFMRGAYIWIPAVVALAGYSLIHVETRFLPGFLILLWLSLFRSVTLPRSAISRKLVWCITLAVAMTVGIGVLRTAVVEGGRLLRHQRNIHWDVAERLRQLGIRPGDRVASIGFSFDGYWAHLAGVTIVTEIPESGAGTFWVSDPEVKAKVFQTFADFGAKAVVCNRVPAYTLPYGWQKIGEQIGDSDFFVRELAVTRPN